jgi:hypothetical protein
MAKRRKTERRKEYNQYFSALPIQKQDEQLNLLLRWFLGVSRSKPPACPPRLKRPK